MIVSIGIIVLFLFVNVYAVPYIKLVINGQQVSTDVPPQIVNGTTLVPIRVISESLGAKVNWDGDTQTVTVDMPRETLEAHTVDTFWNTYCSGTVTEPKIGDSVTPEFKDVLQKALDLLKEKDNTVYRFVCAYIPEIDEQPYKDDNIGAWTDSMTHTVYFNSDNVSQTVSASNTWGTEYTALTLAHEAFHESTICSGSIIPISTDTNNRELQAYTFEYAVAKHIGAASDLQNWLKQQITSLIN
ncbi:copper amine oxidase N-terminal domain-containing protein [Thermoanaerobacterium sp. PSU-2]|uniref:copper amine oxidase N-terminal domain-containing protein n=1 Tax=Thermoanaerobacterium sp. PSU-2 TaxID=1930849 RepID=UPI000A162C55|nr:copper amine oxidase N-terminal domain-containing protein [Thermoanaerobacterium sp. PSU-2]